MSLASLFKHGNMEVAVFFSCHFHCIHTHISAFIFLYIFLGSDSTVIERKCEKVREKQCEIPEECLIVGNKVDFWVEANLGNSSCTSTSRTSILKNTGNGCCYTVALFTFFKMLHDDKKMYIKLFKIFS